MERGGNRDDVEPTTSEERLAALSIGRVAGPRSFRSPGANSRRSGPTTIEAALARVSASAVSIRNYLDRLKQLERWLRDRLRVIDQCRGRVRRLEMVVAGTEKVPPLPVDCPPHLLLVACYADLARQALHGDVPQDCEWRSDQSEGDVSTSLTPDCLFGPLHDTAMMAGLAVLAATDQRVLATSNSRLEELSAERRRKYTSLMSVLPPVQKPGRKLTDLLSLLTKSLHQFKWFSAMGDTDGAVADQGADTPAQARALDNTQLRSFSDFVSHSRPIVRVFALPRDRRLELSTSGNTPTSHEPPSVLMEQLVDVVVHDVQRRFQTETYGAHVVLSQLTQRLETAPRTTDTAEELARELDTHTKLLEMSSRYDNMEALTHSLVTCAVQRVRAQSASTVDKWKSVCPCCSTFHVVVQ